MAKKKAETIWPKVTVGSHLTVTEHENGRTELVWDDDALSRDVREAILKYESNVQCDLKPKATRSKKVKDGR